VAVIEEAERPEWTMTLPLPHSLVPEWSVVSTLYVAVPIGNDDGVVYVEEAPPLVIALPVGQPEPVYHW
jgi:hypothetical protein